MGRKQFRALVGLWIVIFGSRFLPWPAQVPPDVARANLQSLAETTETPLFVGLLVLFFLLLLVGVAGMLRFWKPAPYIFIAAPVLAYLTSPIFGWLALSGWELMFEGLAVLLAGILFATSSLGSAKELFRSPQSTTEEAI